MELVAVKLPGREDRFDESPRENLDKLAYQLSQEIEPSLEVPFAIFGHSMGAAIGYRLAVHLLRKQLPTPTCLFVSACRSPVTFRNDHPLHTLDDQRMLNGLLNRYGTADGTDPKASGELELMQIMANTIRADLKMLETYQHDNAPKLACDIFAMGGTDDPQVTRGELQRWRELTKAKFTVRIFPGHHFYLRKQESAVVKTILSRLRTS